MKFQLFLMLFISVGAWAFTPKVPNGVCHLYWNDEATKTPNYLYDGKENYDKFYERLKRDKCAKEWLVLIYMAADNDLSPYSFRDLWEMETVGSTPSVDVVLFHDHQQKPGMFYKHLSKMEGGKEKMQVDLKKFVANESLEDFDPAEQEKLFWQSKGTEMVASPDVVTLPEGDSGSAKTAGDFIRWAIKKYPSKRLMLIGWSHSEGFDSREALERNVLKRNGEGRQGGFALDQNPTEKGGATTHMSVTTMAPGLKEILKGLRDGEPVDVLGSDACLNQQVEFAYEWTDTATYVFGSANIVQKKGFNYHIFLDYLKRHGGKNTTTEDIAREIPEIYRRSVSEKGDETFRSYPDKKSTLSTWNMSKIGNLKRDLVDVGKQFANWIEKDKENRAPLVRREIIDKSYRFGMVSNDLYHFLELTRDWIKKQKATGDKFDWASFEQDVESARKRMIDSVEAFHVGEEYLKGLYPISRGVAVWLPGLRTEADEMIPKFKASRFYQTDGKPNDWQRFIALLYAD